MRPHPERNSAGAAPVPRKRVRPGRVRPDGCQSVAGPVPGRGPWRRRSGGGLQRSENIPSEPGWGPTDFGYLPGSGATLLGGLLMLADAMGPHQREPRRIAVPDLRGLTYSTCPAIVARVGLRVTAVRLTEHPMPVDGLVVGQSPAAQAKVRRAAEITVQVWHPARNRA